MTLTRRRLIAGLGTGGAVMAARPAFAQLDLLLQAPVKLVNRALEDRSVSDIAKDNEIVLKVNAEMAKVESIKASTEIYEQRLLITGLFDDKPTYDKFYAGVKSVSGIKKLYWQVVYMGDAEQKAQNLGLNAWANALGVNGQCEAKLALAKGVNHLNYRLASDVLGTTFVLGRALSQQEHGLVIANLKGIAGVRKVVDYIQNRPKS